MELKVTTQEKALADAILQKSIQLQPPPEISINFTGIEFKKSLDAPDIAAFVITVMADIPVKLAADLIVTWIMGTFYTRRPQIERISIDETEIKLSKSGQLRKIVRRKINKERRR